MTAAPSTLAARWSALPRSMKWAAVGVAVIGGYFAVVEPALDRLAKLNQRAESNEATLADFRRSEDRVRAAETAVTLGVGRHGVVEYPGDQQSVSVAFNKAVDTVLRKHGVGEQTSTTRVSPMGPGPLSKVVGQEYRVERLARDIQFQASPETLSAVLADLEKTNVVSSVPRVQIRQGENKDKTTRLVRATLSIESWVLTRKAKA